MTRLKRYACKIVLSVALLCSIGSLHAATQNEIGAFTQKHALALAIPVGIIAGALSGNVTTALLIKRYHELLAPYLTREQMGMSLNNSIPVQYLINPETITIVIGSAIITGTLATIIAYVASKKIGQWLTEQQQQQA